jgi:hypothetical protein
MNRRDYLIKEYYNKLNIKNSNYTITLGNGQYGRLGNQIIRNLCISIIAKKFDLYVVYSSHEQIKSLGIDLFSGNMIYDNRIKLTEENFFEILAMEKIDFNLDPNDSFFQTKEITNYLYNYLQNELLLKGKTDEKLDETSDKNSDCFIHIRLGDVASHNPGLEYYLKVLKMISFKKLYIASDDINHSIIKNIIEKYKDSEILLFDEVGIIKFGSKCKNIILSHGSFSAIIGYLSIGSNVYYPKNKDGHVWYGDMCSIPGWTMIEY